MSTKNLGLVAAILFGDVQPSNTRVLWYDTTANQLKYYNIGSAAWEPLTAAAEGMTKLSAGGALDYLGNLLDASLEVVADQLKVADVVLNDIDNSLKKDQNLADLDDDIVARTNLDVFSKTESDARFLNQISNLSDLTSAPTARTNLGLGNAATHNYGKLANTIAQGNDERFQGDYRQQLGTAVFDLTLNNRDQFVFVNMILALPVSNTSYIRIPDASADNKGNIIFVDARYYISSGGIYNLVIRTVSSPAALKTIANDGKRVFVAFHSNGLAWRLLSDLNVASNTDLATGTDDTKYVTPLGFYTNKIVDRGLTDAGDYDFNKLDLTIDNAWHDLSLASLVPAGVKFVLIRTQIDGGIVGGSISLRRNGATATYSPAYLLCPSAGYVTADLWVPVDSGRVIEYKIPVAGMGGYDNIFLTVGGWI